MSVGSRVVAILIMKLEKALGVDGRGSRDRDAYIFKILFASNLSASKIMTTFKEKHLQPKSCFPCQCPFSSYRP